MRDEPKIFYPEYRWRGVPRVPHRALWHIVASITLETEFDGAPTQGSWTLCGIEILSEPVTFFNAPIPTCCDCISAYLESS